MTRRKDNEKIFRTNKLLGSVLARCLVALEKTRNKRSDIIPISKMWSEVVGQEISKQTCVLSYEEGSLLIAVKSASAMQEITLFKLHYINKFNLLTSAFKVKKLQLKLEQGSFL